MITRKFSQYLYCLSVALVDITADISLTEDVHKLLHLYERRAECFLLLNQLEEALSDCLLGKALIQTSDDLHGVKIFRIAAAAAFRLGLLLLAKEFVDTAFAIQPLHVDVASLRSAILACQIPISSNKEECYIFTHVILATLFICHLCQARAASTVGGRTLTAS